MYKVVTQHAIYYQLYVNNKMLQGLRPERGMLKKVLFAAGKIYQENNQRQEKLISPENFELLVIVLILMKLPNDGHQKTQIFPL